MRLLQTLILLATALTTAVAFSTTATAAENYLQRDEYKAFSAKMVSEHGFKPAALNKLFAGVVPQQKIIDAMTRPAEGLPWYKYRPIFMKQPRIDGGVKFWKKHEALLNAVEAKYGVPPEIIVGIIGVETRYGGFIGKHRVIDAIATLGFDYPKRSAFFTSELEHFLLLANEEGFDPTVPVGSYAGAMGLPQFISSSYRNYAVDFNGNGKRDLYNEHADIIGSVANYFVKHGWETGQPVARPARVSAKAAKLAHDDDRLPPHTIQKLATAGTTYDGDKLPNDLPADLLRLEIKDGFEHWLLLKNFYVITRYNHSPLYAMAVFQLAEAIKSERAKTQPGQITSAAGSNPASALKLSRYRSPRR